MIRIFVAALVMLAAAYFYLNQDKATETLSPEAQKALQDAGKSVPLRPEEALDKAKEVEQQMKDQAKKLQEEIDRQSGDQADKKSEKKTGDDE